MTDTTFKVLQFEEGCEEPDVLNIRVQRAGAEVLRDSLDRWLKQDKPDTASYTVSIQGVLVK